MRDRLRRIAGYPLRRTLDPRVEWTHSFIDERLGAHDHQPPVHHRLDTLERKLDALLRWSGQRTAAEAPGSMVLDELTEELAAFLNWNEGPDGLAAQAGLWLNPPAPVEYRPGAVDVLLVNERVVEQPFVFRALAALEPGARVLDVGGSESSVALSLASLGHETVVVDPRGYRLDHPSLTVRACRLDELGAPDASFDAAIALSAVEHFGLGHYEGSGGAGARADIAALRLIAGWLRPGGRLVLTVPCGTASVDGFQRVYDDRGLDELLDGWTVRTRAFARREGERHWVLCPAAPTGPPGVALIVAERP